MATSVRTHQGHVHVEPTPRREQKAAHRPGRKGYEDVEQSANLDQKQNNLE